MSHYLKAMQLCNGAKEPVDGTDGILCFAVRHEVETRARANGSTSGTPKNTTSLPRDCSLRASAVIGFKCPDKGMLTKPIFIVAPFFLSHEPPHSMARATTLVYVQRRNCVLLIEPGSAGFIPRSVRCSSQPTPTRQSRRSFEWMRNRHPAGNG